MRTAIVSTFPPRACGIGAFAADLRSALFGAQQPLVASRHDDCVDALAGAHNYVTKLPTRRYSVSIPTGRTPTPTQTAVARGGIYSSHTDPIETLATRLGARIWDNSPGR